MAFPRTAVVVGTCVLLLVISGCTARSDPTADEVPPESRRWIEIFADSNYTVDVDMGNVTRRLSGWEEYDIWYRTRHRRPHLRRGEAWNLEYTRSVVRCDSLWYKVLSVDLSDHGRRTVSQQRTDYMDQPWRKVEVNSVERFVALRACDIARSYATQEGRARR